MRESPWFSLAFLLGLAQLVGAGPETASYDFGNLAWLDVPIGRFLLPSEEGAFESLESQTIRLAKQARARMSVEYGPIDYSCGSPPGTAARRAAFEPATPRAVLDALVRARQHSHPITTECHGEFLCVLEKRVANDATWPLNVREVPGFSVEGVTYDDLFDRVIHAIGQAHRQQLGDAEAWEIVRGPSRRDYWSASVADADGLDMGGQITATFRPGSARDLLCQLAMLRPNCVWSAFARWDPVDPLERASRCVLYLTSWSRRHGKSTSGLVKMLERDSEDKGSQVWDNDEYQSPANMRLDVLSELQTRGQEGLEALMESYSAAANTEYKCAVLHDYLPGFAVWPDSARLLKAFAERELAGPGRPYEGALEELVRLAKETLAESVTPAGMEAATDKAAARGGHEMVYVGAFLAALACTCALVLLWLRRRRRKQ